MKNTSHHSRMTWVFCVIVVLFISSCSNDTIDAITVTHNNERGELVSYTNVGELNTNQIVSINTSEGDISNYAQHAVDVYSVVYNSLDNEELLQVSGLVMIPQGLSSSLPLIQYHHGTTMPISGEDEIPSNYAGTTNYQTEIHFVGATMASNGYVVSLPDYVGYGKSKDREHPYTYHHELAEVSVDMLRATEQLLEILKINFSSDVFLTGWSEGGGAGLAVHKYLELNYPNEFNLKGSSLFAGPYDYLGFIRHIFTNKTEETENITIYNWSSYVLNKYHSSLQRSGDQIWKYNVNNQFDALNTPSYTAEAVWKASFMDNILANNDSQFIQAAQENSLIEGWTPTKNVFFHSGTSDLIVPHFNSVNAYNKFNQEGAPVQLYEYQGGDHYTPLFEYVTKTLDDFNDL